MTREEMNATIARELDHIPSGRKGSAQNRLRMVYRMTRSTSLGEGADTPDLSKEYILAESIHLVRQKFPSAVLEYSTTFFGSLPEVVTA